VRRVVVIVLVGLLGVVVGGTVGFVVSQRQKLHDSGRLEAVGTWVGAGATLLAVILGAIAYLSEEFARRREQRRQADAAKDAKRAEEQRLQLAADLVFCDIRVAETTDMPVGPRRIGFDEVEIVVDNRSGSVVTDLRVEFRYPMSSTLAKGLGWSMPIMEPINNGEVVIRKFEPLGASLETPLEPLEGVGLGDLRENVTFTFSLNGHLWWKQLWRGALRLTTSR
jgi:hypothetical protein